MKRIAEPRAGAMACPKRVRPSDDGTEHDGVSVVDGVLVEAVARPLQCLSRA